MEALHINSVAPPTTGCLNASFQAFLSMIRPFRRQLQRLVMAHFIFLKAKMHHDF
jgi:hypothetical protein